MKEEFNLSEKIEFEGDGGVDWLKIKDVKEFIRLLKEKLRNFYGKNCSWLNEIDKLAGEELLK